MAEICNKGDQSIPTLIDQQKTLFKTGKLREIGARTKALKALLHAIEDKEDELIEALVQDVGKPPVEGWLSEVFFMKNEIRYILKRLEKWSRPRKVSTPVYLWPARSEVQLEAYGVVMVMAPWNYPFQLALSPAIGAIAAGNCVMIKPAEATPNVSRVMAEVVAEAFPPEHMTVVRGNLEVSKEVLEQPFDYFFFTGGETVGRKVAEAAAREMVPCTLELGGKSPAILHESCDLDVAVERLAGGKFFNAGQTCMAPDFVAVPEAMLGDFLEKFRIVMNEIYGTAPMELAKCPHKSQWDRVRKLLPEGAEQVGEDDEENLRLAPRWKVVDWKDDCMQDEIFGPFLPIISYGNLDELLDKIGQKKCPLALYLFGKDEHFIAAGTEKISTGSVCINDVMKQAMSMELPFGGTGLSGYGRYRGKTSYETFSWERSFLRRYNFPDLFKTHPPYGDKLKLLRKFLG